MSDNDTTEDANDPRRATARYMVSPPLLKKLKDKEAEQKAAQKRSRSKKRAVEEAAAAPPPPAARVIIELNVDYSGTPETIAESAIDELRGIGVDEARCDRAKARRSRYNLFLSMSLQELEKLAELLREKMKQNSRGEHSPYPIHKVWPDDELKPFIDRSARTIKADACWRTFSASGTDIVVAVADSGIDKSHWHFDKFKNTALPDGLKHKDFTDDGLNDDNQADDESALQDPFGHGTHVAGIIAGYSDGTKGTLACLREVFTDHEETESVQQDMKDVVLSGVAPEAKLLSLKVLNNKGQGYASSLIAALEHVYDLNDSGRKMRVHCVNLSLGYPFDAAWYAAGQSPLCAVVNRLARNGVVVVAAAGNDGAAMLKPEGSATAKRIGLDQSINDPGNAEEAITVGSTHGDSPHLYGVSFFSSRGPTADGRVKPDLVAPGERIVSCAATRSTKLATALAAAGASADDGKVYFLEESGTSMAAPHVAGAVAAFLSVRREFIGQPNRLKQILLATCTDLGRKKDFQGAGLLDVLRALQSV